MYYEIVKRLLGLSIQEIAESRKLNGKQALQVASKYLATMSTEWFKGKAPTIAYDDPLCRWAYIFAHVAVHANCLEAVIRKCESASAKFSKRIRRDELSILTFGGGPGTELMALAKHFAFLKDQNKGKDYNQVDVRLTIVDRISAWSENITLVQEEIDRVYKNGSVARHKWPARFSVFAHVLDMTDIKAFGNLPSLFKKKDLFIFNYMISEIFNLEHSIPTMRAISKSCADASYFLFVDRKDQDTKAKINFLIKKIRLKIVVEGESANYDTVDGDEQKSLLGPISRHLGREPRHTWNSCWRLAIKS